MTKKLFAFLLSLCCLICCAFALTACGNGGTGGVGQQGPNVGQEQPGNFTLERAYATACGLGYDGTLEEFLNLINYNEVENDKDDVCVQDVYIDQKGHLIVVFSDGTIKDCGKIAYLEVCEHDFTEWSVEVEPNCTAPGYTVRECKLCGEKEYGFFKAKGHSFGEVKIMREPTCEEKGLWYVECADCGVPEISEIVPLGHEPSAEWVIEQNIHRQFCVRCGKEFVSEAHIIENGACKVCGLSSGSEGLKYALTDNTATVSGIGTCKYKNVVIPEYIYGRPVTAIATDAFRYCEQLESISIPASVNYIGSCAFDFCKNLKGVYITDLAAWCNATIVRHGSSWASGSNPLKYAGNLYLNGGLVTELVIPEGVTTIQDGAFWGCTSIESIYIPASVKEINDFAFAECINIESINVSPDNNIFYSAGNCIIQKSNKSVFMGCKTSVIPSDGSVTTIGYEAFQYCRSLTRLTIPDTIKTISGSAFFKCENLTDLIIPYGVTYIGSLAFAYCISLKSIVIPDSVTHIGNQAFSDCKNLESITVPDSVTELSSKSYSYTAYYNNQKNWEGDALYIGKHLVATKSTVKGRYTIKDGTLTVSDRVFSNRTSLTEIVVPASVVYIGDSAFTYCTSLKNAYYEGTEERWKEIVDFHNWVVEDYDYLRHATVYFYSEENPFADGMQEGNYWRYVDGKVTVWNSHVHSFTDSNVCDKCGYHSLEYQLTDGYYTVTGLGKSAAALKNDIHLYIPEEINGIPVKEIGASAFRNSIYIRSVTIPKSIVKIDNNAFGSSLKDMYIDDLAAYCRIEMINWSPSAYVENIYCNGELLTELVIPEGVEKIGRGVFYGYKKLTKAVIPSTVKSIGEVAFRKCENLQNVTFAEGSKLEFIGAYSFCECKSLSSISLPQTVTEIGDSAFSFSGFTLFVFPESVTKIGKDVLAHCEQLVRVKLPSQLTEISEYMLYYCPSLRVIKIPDGVTKIGSSAFRNCSSLLKIDIPDSVTFIGSYAFANCTSLKSAVIPESVESVLSATFYNSTALEYVEISGSVSKMMLTFAGCTSLKSAVIPATVNHMLKVFDDCVSIESVYFAGTVGQWDKIMKSPNDEYLQNATIYYYSVEYPFVNGVTEGNFWHYVDGEIIIWELYDHDHVFAGTNYCEVCGFDGLEYYTYDGYCSVYRLSSDLAAFEGELNIIIPEKHNGLPVTEIYSGFIHEHTNVKSVVIASTVTEIGTLAFWNCTGLERIVIPSSVTMISTAAFLNCTGLKEVHIPNFASWFDIDFSGLDANPLHNGTAKLYADGKAVEGDVIFPEGVVGIRPYSFSGYGHITKVTLPANVQVTRIGNFAFYDCANLKEVIIPDTYTEIMPNAFSYCANLKSVTIGNGVTSIGSSAFLHTGLNEVIIPDSVIEISQSAFRDCSYLQSVKLSENLTRIGIQVFMNCSSLKSITIPNGVTYISMRSFSGCESLESVVIPDTVTETGWYSFEGCSNLKSIVIGSGMSSVGNGLVKGCTNLERVYYNGSAEQWSQIQFGEENEELLNATLYFYSGQNPFIDGAVGGNFWRYVDGEIVLWTKED